MEGGWRREGGGGRGEEGGREEGGRREGEGGGRRREGEGGGRREGGGGREGWRDGDEGRETLHKHDNSNAISANLMIEGSPCQNEADIIQPF